MLWLTHFFRKSYRSVHAICVLLLVIIGAILFINVFPYRSMEFYLYIGPVSVLPFLRLLLSAFSLVTAYLLYQDKGRNWILLAAFSACMLIYQGLNVFAASFLADGLLRGLYLMQWGIFVFWAIGFGLMVWFYKVVMQRFVGHTKPTPTQRT